MRHRFFLLFVLGLVVASCVKDQQEIIQTNDIDQQVFYATIEATDDSATRAYADTQLRVLWNADDRVSIFNKSTYNRQYRFDGQDGDNSGAFKVVPNDGFATSNPLDYVYSVYPYNENTKISNDGEITVYLPAEQTYRENSFGLGANTMIAITQGDELMFKNLCGYFAIKLYGDNVSVSSISLKGNKNELLAGKATVVAQINASPVLQLDSSEATKELTLTFDTPVVLGSTAETASTFWFVIPPTTFDGGITLTVRDENNGFFEKTTSGSLEIRRNTLKKTSELKIEPADQHLNSVIYYTSSDGEIINPWGTSFGGASIISNEYVDGQGMIVFNGAVTDIGTYAFFNSSRLTSLVIPDSVISIGERAFHGCSNLESIIIPKGITLIDNYAFSGCLGLKDIIVLPDEPPVLGLSPFPYIMIYVPEGKKYDYRRAAGWSNYSDFICEKGDITQIHYTSSDNTCITLNSLVWANRILSNECSEGSGILTIAGDLTTLPRNAFSHCTNLSGITLPEGIGSIEPGTFYGCTSLSSIAIPTSVTIIGEQAFVDCSSLSSASIPEGVKYLEDFAFCNCKKLTSISLPKSMTSIGGRAFYNCTSLSRVDIKAVVPPSGGPEMFPFSQYCFIYVPSGSEDAYVNADYWKDYAIQMWVEGGTQPLAYSSTDYSQDGEIIQLQQAIVGRGINIIFLGDGFLDKDMGEGGKYEMKVRAAMEQFFAYEPYSLFRDRFNIWAVKVVSKNDYYGYETSDRRLTYEKDKSFYMRTALAEEYASNIPNPYNQPLKICTVCNTEVYVARSWCFTSGFNDYIVGNCFVNQGVGPVLNHELGGHAFGLLWDEYVENNETFTNFDYLDYQFSLHGMGANVDWRNDPETVRWAHFLKDSRYSQEGLGVFEGGYLYPHGIYRATENSMMRYNDCPFNAPSREQIYKFIMKYSEGDDWEYDYEEFVKADESGRKEAAESYGALKAAPKRLSSVSKRERHNSPVLIDKDVKEIGVDNEGDIIFIY